MARPRAHKTDAAAVSNHEYFVRAVKEAIYMLVGEPTEHGFVFRVDGLAANGNSGPPVVSQGALEEYFMVQGASGSASPGSRAGWSRRAP